MKKYLLIIMAIIVTGVFACDFSRPKNEQHVVTGESDEIIAEGYYQDLDKLPRRMQFSKDNHRLVTGPGEPKDFYDFSHIRRMEIQFPEENWSDKLDAIYGTGEEIPARLIYDGEELPADVGIRFKGSSSYDENKTAKKSFAVSVDYEDKKQRINGFKNLNLHCEIKDNSLMKEVIYEHMNQNYAPAPDTNYVELYINGQPWGLYVNTQQLDNDFIKDWFLSQKGTRWRAQANGAYAGKYTKGYSSLNYLGELPSDYETYYTLKSTDLDDPWTDLINVCRVLNQTPADRLETEINKVMDLDRALWFLVIENVFGDNDSYLIKGSVDYYLYFEPTTGWLTPLEFDADMFGLGPLNIRLSPLYGLNDKELPLLNKLLNVPNIRERYLAHMRTVLKESFNPQTMNAVIDAYAAKIDAYVKKETKGAVTHDNFLKAVKTLKANIETRHNVLTKNSSVAAEGLSISDVKWLTRGVTPWASPSPSDEVTISAKVAGTPKIGTVYAYMGTGVYGPFSKMKMYDDGEHNDGKANDGIFGIIVPPQESGTRIRFYIEAVCDDSTGTRTYYPAKAEHDVFTWEVVQ